MMTDSGKLLAEYVRTGSEAAFRELVNCHLDLVYSVALRIVEGDAHRAQDVAQAVFVDLACRARTLSRNVRLGGWLHRHTCFLAANAMRGERRRQARERQAVEMNALQTSPEADSARMAPILDQAINELGETDRAAILLRFYEQRDFRSVGQVLGSNEEAARKRVTRALEKLRSLLKRRGIRTSAAALAAVLTASAVQAAPAGLAASIAALAAPGGVIAAASATAIVKTLTMTTLQKTLIAAALVAAAGSGIYEAHQASSLRSQVQTLQAQQGPLAEQLAQFKSDNENLSNQLARAPRPSDEGSTELLRLRGEVTGLRQRKSELEQLLARWNTSAGTHPTNLVARESWGFAGYDTPEAALETTVWAKSTGNEKLWLASLGSSNMVEWLQHWVKGSSDEERTQFLLKETKDWIGQRILREVPVDEDTVLIQAEVFYLENGQTNSHLAMEEMKKIAGAWKVVQEYNR